MVVPAASAEPPLVFEGDVGAENAAGWLVGCSVGCGVTGVAVIGPTEVTRGRAAWSAVPKLGELRVFATDNAYADGELVPPPPTLL